MRNLFWSDIFCVADVEVDEEWWRWKNIYTAVCLMWGIGYILPEYLSKTKIPGRVSITYWNYQKYSENELLHLNLFSQLTKY